MSDEPPTAYNQPNAFGSLGFDMDWGFLDSVIESATFSDGGDHGLATLTGDANNAITSLPNFGMNHAQAGSDHMSDPAEAFADLRMSTPPTETVLPTSIWNYQNNTNFQGLPSEVPVQVWAGGDTPDGSLMKTLQTLNQPFNSTENPYSPVNQAFQPGPAVQYGPGLEAPAHPSEATEPITVAPQATLTPPQSIQNPVQPLQERRYSRICPRCGKTLSRPTSVWRHLKSSCPRARDLHVLVSCPRCGRGFPKARPDSLRRHLRSHCPQRSA
ncbi:hypothetical protein PENSPDRAFT_353514 [Peniophora sp. CONT]|nr:hypothetical protein PENSPDRAFT_353514 [Peniophora sp. CONT]